MIPVLGGSDREQFLSFLVVVEIHLSPNTPVSLTSSHLNRELFIWGTLFSWDSVQCLFFFWSCLIVQKCQIMLTIKSDSDIWNFFRHNYSLELLHQGVRNDLCPFPKWDSFITTHFILLLAGCPLAAYHLWWTTLREKESISFHGMRFWFSQCSRCA